MAWDEVKPESVDELSDILLDLGTKDFLCRGQTRMDESWEHLTTSLSRALSHRQAVGSDNWNDDVLQRITALVEIALMEQFRQRGHIHLNAT